LEIKSLLLGVFFSIGVFAFKSGVGLSYFLSAKRGWKMQTVALVLHSLIYFLLFFVSMEFIERIDFLQHFDAMQGFMKSGMSLHLLLAGLMSIWGVALLRRGKKKEGEKDSIGKRFGWLTMAVPCPVCGTVVFMSVAFLLSFYPEDGTRAVFLMYVGFMAINFISIALFNILQKRLNATPETMLGMFMVAIAVYFGLSVSVMPQFGDIDKIYRLAQYQGEVSTINIKNQILFCGFIIAAGMIGFAIRIIKIRSIK